MDFDSLNALNNNSVQKNLSPDYTMNKVVETKQKNDNVKVNDTAAKVNFSSDDANNVNGKIDEKAQGTYKGNYSEDMEKAVELANEKLKTSNSTKQFSYSIHEATKQVMITIKDSQTGEVLKEIPSEESLDFFAKLQELSGILVDEKR